MRKFKVVSSDYKKGNVAPLSFAEKYDVAVSDVRHDILVVLPRESIDVREEKPS